MSAQRSAAQRSARNTAQLVHVHYMVITTTADACLSATNDETDDQDGEEGEEDRQILRKRLG